MSIWSELPNGEILTSGDLWETDDFSVVFKDYICVDDLGLPWLYVDFDFTLENMTIEECHDCESMFFGIYAIYKDKTWERLWIDDYYYDDMFNNIDGSNAKGTLYLCGEDCSYLAILVIFEGRVYKTAYKF